MKKLTILIIILLFAFIFESNSQNLVPNSDFESGLTPWITPGPVNDRNAYLFAQGETTIEDDPINLTLNGIGCYVNTFDTLSLSVPDNHFGTQSAFNGSQYAGLWADYLKKGCSDADGTSNHGLIGIEFTSPLLKCIKYIVSFRVSKMDNSTKNPEFEVIIAKELNNNNKPKKDKKIYEGETSNQNEWQTISFEYQPEEEGYKYLFIKTNNKGSSAYFSGFYLDDVFVGDKCEVDFPCSRTKGCFYPTISNVINQTSAFEVDNIGNAETIALTINDLAGNLVFSKSLACPNGISGPVYWLGGWNDIAIGYYQYSFTLLNDCGSKYFSGILYKGENFTGTRNDFVCTTGALAIPLPCCQQDLYIQNVQLSDTHEIKVLNNIIIGPNVTIKANSSILFQAGNEITGTPEINDEAGAEYEMKIEACPPMRMAGSGSGADESTEASSLTELFIDEPEAKEIEEKVTSAFSLHPNPNNGTFTLTLPDVNAPHDIIIYDLLGNVIYHSKTIDNQRIDISTQPKGVYFVKVSSGNEVWVRKVVHQ